jgi:hypothetical protein
MRADTQRVFDLLALNIALQVFDAVATYQGLRIGWQEANPILAAAFLSMGVFRTLLLTKGIACGLLCLLLYCRRRYLVVPALRFLATVYCGMSLFPWLTKYLTLLVQAI